MSLLLEMQANVEHLPLSQLFTLKEMIEEIIQNRSSDKNRLSNKELRSLFSSFTGSIDRQIDEKQEKLEYLDERYASAD